MSGLMVAEIFCATFALPIINSIDNHFGTENKIVRRVIGIIGVIGMLSVIGIGYGAYQICAELAK